MQITLADRICLLDPTASPLTVYLDAMRPRIILTWRGREKGSMVWRNRRWEHDD